MITIKNQGYISLYVTEIKELYFTSFYVAFHVILCRIYASRISRIAPHYTSFYVSFHVILSWKFISYSFMPFRIEERRNRFKMPRSSIERHLSEVF